MMEEPAEHSLLEQRHKKERKELQAQIIALKHSVSKSDTKKRKNQVAAEIAVLEAQLDAKHQADLLALKDSGCSESSGSSPSKENLANDDDSNITGENEGNNGVQRDQEEEQGMTKKTSKAQKRREKKDAEARERNHRISEGEMEAKKGVRHKELQALDSVLKERNLQIYEIPADGDCLFNALAHQLFLLGFSSSGEEIRQKTSVCMKSHADEFMPFLLDEHSGDLLGPDEYQKYCDNIAKPTVWGGQPEIKAFSMSYEQPVEIVQGSGAPQIVGEEYTSEHKRPLVIAYHRHAYRLGEHYNSTEPRKEEDEFVQQ